MPYLAPIVEGYGEVDAVPAMLHRIAQLEAPTAALRVNAPIRVKSASFLNDRGYFDRYVALAAAKAAQEDGSVLILLDCEDDCPAALGPKLLRQALAVRADVGVLVVLAHREYETWFLAAARSLRGRRGLPDDLDRPPAPERIRDAKGWLASRMDGGYDPVIHQLEFSRAMDLVEARANPSFDRYYRHIRDFLVGSIHHQRTPEP